VQISLDEVKITRRREREDVGDLESLALSLAKFGQLQPIVLDRNGELIAGFRRYSAHRMNGATTIMAIYRDEVDETLAKELELEENIRRKQMTWQEEARGLAELNRLRMAKDPNWTQVKTAQLAGGGTSQRDISQAVQMEKLLEVFPELAKAKSLNQAQSWAKAKASSIQRVIDVKASPEDYSSIEERLVLGDSVDVIRTIPDESFHAIITDPPFGIDYEDRTAGTSDNVTAYADDKAAYERLLTMAPDMYRVLRPNGWCVWFLGITWYERAKLAFREAGFTVDEIPIIWDRSEGRTFTSRPDRWFGRGYDIALHMVKGEPRMAKWGSNVISIPPVPASEKEQSVERPVELYAELITRLTIPGEKIADFFAGAGGCPAACELTKRDWFAVEKSPERRARAIQKVKAYTPDK
jgi:ParB/RepB/Spo0J family partition protein